MRIDLNMSTSTWIRKGLEIARLPRVRLNNIQDLPGAKKKVNVTLLPAAVLKEFSISDKGHIL